MSRLAQELRAVLESNPPVHQFGGPRQRAFPSQDDVVVGRGAQAQSVDGHLAILPPVPDSGFLLGRIHAVINSSGAAEGAERRAGREQVDAGNGSPSGDRPGFHSNVHSPRPPRLRVNLSPVLTAWMRLRGSPDDDPRVAPGYVRAAGRRSRAGIVARRIMAGWSNDRGQLQPPRRSASSGVTFGQSRGAPATRGWLGESTPRDSSPSAQRIITLPHLKPRDSSPTTSHQTPDRPGTDATPGLSRRPVRIPSALWGQCQVAPPSSPNAFRPLPASSRNFNISPCWMRIQPDSWCSAVICRNEKSSSGIRWKTGIGLA